jgi:hypothetical protein
MISMIICNLFINKPQWHDFVNPRLFSLLFFAQKRKKKASKAPSPNDMGAETPVQKSDSATSEREREPMEAKSSRGDICGM